MTDSLAGLSAEEKRVLLARLLMEKAEASASAHPLSYGQRSLWFLYQLAPGSPAYTITYAGQIRGELDRDRTAGRGPGTRRPPRHLANHLHHT